MIENSRRHKGDTPDLTKLKESFNQKEEDYKSQIARLEALLQIKDDSSSSTNQSKPKSEMSWLDDDTHLNPRHNLQSNSSTGDLKALEQQLTKEKMTNQRLQSDIDRLTLHMKSTFISSSSSNENIQKYIKEINLENIKLEKKIGSGGFSTIYNGLWNNTIEVAVKEIFDPNITNELIAEFHNEVNMLFLIRHPNIIALYGICTKEKKLSIVTELASRGSLFDYLYKNPNNKEMENDLKHKIVRQLINVMKFIHESGLVHRDLKSQNILFDEQMNIKLCDFGLMKPLAELNCGSGQFSGTPTYMAPEILSRKAYDEKVDQFAFGTILYEIFVKKIPYYGCDPSELKTKLNQGEKLNIPKTVPSSISDLILKCRELNSALRPSFDEISKMILN